MNEPEGGGRRRRRLPPSGLIVDKAADIYACSHILWWPGGEHDSGMEEIGKAYVAAPQSFFVKRIMSGEIHQRMIGKKQRMWAYRGKTDGTNEEGSCRPGGRGRTVITSEQHILANSPWE